MQKRNVVNPETIIGAFNQMVLTPLGQGRSFGPMQIKDAHKEGIVDAVVVRLPIDETTSPRRKDENCLTPNASVTGLWIFQRHELKVSEQGGGWLGNLALACLVIGIIIVLGWCGVPW